MSKILIIDDQAPIRRVLRDILENESYQVEDVASGIEALQVVKEQEFDAIFLAVFVFFIPVEDVAVFCKTDCFLPQRHGVIDILLI